MGFGWQNDRLVKDTPPLISLHSRRVDNLCRRRCRRPKNKPTNQAAKRENLIKPRLALPPLVAIICSALMFCPNQLRSLTTWRSRPIFFWMAEGEPEVAKIMFDVDREALLTLVICFGWTHRLSYLMRAANILAGGYPRRNSVKHSALKTRMFSAGQLSIFPRRPCVSLCRC